MEEPKFGVGIIGCGLGGLAAAIGISRAGHSVTIFEQASKLGEVGAGIQVPPNATRILHRWGLLAKVKAVCVEPADVTYRSYRDGKPLHNQRYVPSLETRYGFPYLQIHRADYHRILVEEARRLGVSIVLGAKVMGVDFERTALTIQTQPGVEVVFDLVLGADGLSSMCREAVVGHVSPPHRTGDLAYRMVIKAEDMKQESHLNKFIRNAALNFWMGPRGHLVGYSLRKEGLYNIVAICPDDLPELVNTMQCELDEVRDIFREWDPKIGEMFDLVQHTTKWRLMTGSELAAWSKGNFTLLGDACHATLPYLSQGAALAIEDGAVLGALFEHVQQKSEIPTLLRIYESLRKPRTSQVMRLSSRQRDVMHLPDGNQQRERDRKLTEEEPSWGFPNYTADPFLQAWLFGYDAHAEAQAAMIEFRTGQKHTPITQI